MPYGSALDWSYARLSNEQLAYAKSIGYLGALRYLGSDARCLTPPERDQIHGAGLRVGLIWETSARRPMSGFSGGAADARSANAYADALGAPAWLPIVYATDFGPSDDELSTVVDYYRGVLRVPGMRPVGCYGAYPVLEAVAPLGLVWHWQTAGWSGFGQGSGGTFVCTGETVGRRLSKHADLFQDLGARVAGTDHNAVLKDTLRSWTWHPSDRHDQPEEEGDMAVQVAACDPHRVPRVAALLGARGVNPALDHASFLVDSNGHSMRFLVSAEAADYWIRLGNYVAALAGKPQNTDLGVIDDPLFWAGYSLSEDPPSPSELAGIVKAAVKAAVTESLSGVTVEAPGTLTPEAVEAVAHAASVQTAALLGSRLLTPTV